MNISHHPEEEILARYAAGGLDGGQRLVVGVHVASCTKCRRLVAAIEELGGRTLEGVEPAGLSTDAFEQTLSAALAAKEPMPAFVSNDDNEDGPLPELLRTHRIGRRRRIAPGVSLRPIELPYPSQSRVFLLRSAPGTRMLEHTHSGAEYTCVLKGSFSHEKGEYRPGDFDYGDPDVDHEPIVGAEGPCVCLVAMTGDLRPNGWIGRLIAPFIRI